MDLHLVSNSDNFVLIPGDHATELIWRINVDLRAFNRLSLLDFRIRPGWPKNASKFSLVSCNLIKSDIANPQSIIHVSTSYNHSIRSLGKLLTSFNNIISSLDTFSLDRAVADQISFSVSNAKIPIGADVKISLRFSHEVQDK